MKKKYKKAFTLVEMLVVVSVIGIISGISVVAIKNYQPTMNLNGIARDIVTDLRYAQQLTVSEQVKHGIKFCQIEKKYQVIRYGAEEIIIKEANLPQGVSYQSIEGFTLERARFNPYGAVEEGGTVVLINEESKTKTIEIKPSGFVKMQ